jgi:hypothetical protein
MSALDDAIRERVAKENPDRPLVGWVVIAATMLPDDDEATDLTVVPADGQMAHSTAGLLTLAMENVRTNRG